MNKMAVVTNQGTTASRKNLSPVALKRASVETLCCPCPNEHLAVANRANRGKHHRSFSPYKPQIGKNPIIIKFKFSFSAI